MPAEPNKTQETSAGQDPIQFAEFTLDMERRAVFRASERVPLTQKPFEVLTYLVRNRGKVVSKAELLSAVWGGHQDDNLVEQAVRQIRLALREEAKKPRFVQTLPGQGYLFIGAPGRNPPPATPVVPDSKPDGAVPTYHRFVYAALLIVAIIAVVTFRSAPRDLKLTNPVKITRSQTRILSPLLTDGARIFYQRFENGRYTLAEVAGDGGDTISPRAEIPNPELCDIAPDGASLLLRDLVHSREDNEPVYIQPLIGGSARRVGEILAYDAAFYPDGRHILYSNAGAVYSADLEGRSKRPLFTFHGNAEWFRWSPDARTLRFSVIDAKTEATALWEWSATGTQPRRLLPEFPYQQCCGSWTADGRSFVFQTRVDTTFQIWSRREAAGFLRMAGSPAPLAQGTMNYRGPLPGKDGRKLFLRSEAPQGQFVRYDQPSGQFITLLPSISARTAAFSRDGRRIAYTSLADNNLWQCAAGGSECRQLTRGLQQTALPRWSPDGRTLVFMGRQPGGNWRIFAVSADGQDMHPLTPAGRSDGDPDWSPAGDRVVFGNVLEPPETKAIYILNLAAKTIQTLPGSQGYYSPRWSPDGRFVVAINSRDRTMGLFNFASAAWERLTDIPGAYPNWSHDGKYVYFLANGAGGRAIFRTGIQTRNTEKFAGLEGVERAPFMMGDWIGLTPDDSPMAVRNLTTEDIYAWDFASP